MYHLRGVLLRVGSVIEPGNWGRVIELYGSSHPRVLCETALELSRATEFAHRPSLLKAAFTCPTMDALRLHKKETQKLSEVACEVELADAASPLFEADWTLVSPHGMLRLDRADEYWQGAGEGRATREVLTLWPLRILKRIDLSDTV